MSFSFQARSGNNLVYQIDHARFEVPRDATPQEIKKLATASGVKAGYARAIASNIHEDASARWLQFSRAGSQGPKVPDKGTSKSLLSEMSQKPANHSVPSLGGSELSELGLAISVWSGDDASPKGFVKPSLSTQYSTESVHSVENLGPSGHRAQIGQLGEPGVWNNQMGDLAPVLMASFLGRPIEILMGGCTTRIGHDLRTGKELDGSPIRLLNSGDHYYIVTPQGPVSMPTDGNCFYHAIVKSTGGYETLSLRTKLQQFAEGLDDDVLAGFTTHITRRDVGPTSPQGNEAELAANLGRPLWVVNKDFALLRSVNKTELGKTLDGAVAMVQERDNKYYAVTIGLHGVKVDRKAHDSAAAALRQLGGSKVASAKVGAKLGSASAKPVTIKPHSNAPENMGLQRKARWKDQDTATFVFRGQEKDEAQKRFRPPLRQGSFEGKVGYYGFRPDKPNLFDAELGQKQMMLTRFGFNDIDSEDRKFLANNIVQFAGHFAPPHKGHYGCVKAALKAGAGSVLVTINRQVLNHFVDQDIAMRMWDVYLRADGFLPEEIADKKGNLRVNTPKSGKTIHRYTNKDGKVVFLSIRTKQKNKDAQLAVDKALIHKAYEKFDAYLNSKDCPKTAPEVKLNPDHVVRLNGLDVFEGEAGPNKTLAKQVDAGMADNNTHFFGTKERGVPLRIILNRKENGGASASMMMTQLDNITNRSGKNVELIASDNAIRKFCQEFMPSAVNSFDIKQLKAIVKDLAQRRKDILDIGTKRMENIPDVKKKTVQKQKIEPVAAALNVPYNDLRESLGGKQPWAEL